jgi:YesN/AraC family two-component response regulator
MKLNDLKKTSLPELRECSFSLTNELATNYDFLYTDNPIVLYITKGTISFSYLGKVETANQGEIFYLSKDRFFVINSLTNQSQIKVLYLLPNATPTLKKMDGSNSFPYFHLSPTTSRRKKMQEDIEDLIDSLAKEEDVSLLNESRLLDFLALLSLEAPMNDKTPRNKKAIAHCLSLMDYVSANVSRPLTLKEITAFDNLSPHEGNRLFRQETGTSLIQYANEQRLLQAAYFLKDNKNIPIAKVGMKYGFASKSYFGELFKKYFLMSPGEYLERCSISKWTLDPTKALEDYFSNR